MTEKSPQLPEKKRAPGDWDEVRTRLHAAEEATGDVGKTEPAEKLRILKERARLLAVTEGEGPGKEMPLSIVEFLLAYEHYGIESVYVGETLQIRELTHLPGTPPFVLGIINVRGTIHSVIDLKKFFNLPDRGLPEFNKVLVIRDKEMKFGIVVDSVVGTRQVLRSALRPPPPTFTGTSADYVKGVASGPVIILDGAKILADRNLIVNEQGV